MKTNQQPDSHKVGWRIDEWNSALGIKSRQTPYNLRDRGEIEMVKIGDMTIITTSPAEYLARKAAEQNPAQPALPAKRPRGRPRKIRHADAPAPPRAAAPDDR